MTRDEIKKPIIPNLQSEYLLMIKECILKENDLKIGDRILWEFDHDIIRSGYKRGTQAKYNIKKLCEGILKEDENGFLYAESIEDLDFYQSKYKNEFKMTGHYYKLVKKKSKHYFGSGWVSYYKTKE